LFVCIQVITVLDRSYHPEHLRCTACNIEIGRRDFYEKSGKPYCEQDYRRLFAPKCARCDQPIIDVNEIIFDKIILFFFGYFKGNDYSFKS